MTGPSGRRDITWRFAHQLTCQMLTGAIPQLRRQRLHLRVADAMARLDRESRVYTSGIAHHLYCAGRLADPGRTARALIAAGDAAHAVYATEEAVQHYRRALEVLQETSGDAASAARRAGNARRSAGAAGRSRRSDGALRQRRAADIAPHGRPSIRRASPARPARSTGRPAIVPRRWRRIGARSNELSGSAAHIEAAHLYQELGLAAFRSGDNQQAVEWAERALQSAERALTEPASRRGPGPQGGDGRDRTGHQYDRRGAGAIGSARRRPRAHRAQSRRGAGSGPARRRLPRLRESRRALQLGRAETCDRRLADRPRDRVEDRRRLAAVVHLREPGGRVLRAHRCAAKPKASRRRRRPPRSTASWDNWITSPVPLVVIAQIHQCRGELQKAQDGVSRGARAGREDRRAAVDPPVLRRPRHDPPGSRRPRSGGGIHGESAAAVRTDRPRS